MEARTNISLDQILEESGVGSQFLEKECSQDNLLCLAEYCDSTTVVGYALGLSDIQVSDVERDYKTSEEKRVGLVLKWKQNSGFKATNKRFVEALLSCGRNNAAREICRQLAKQTEAEPDSKKTSVPSSVVASEQQSEHNTLSSSNGEQGLQFQMSKEISQHTQQEQVKHPLNVEPYDLLQETSHPPSNDSEECSSLSLKLKVNDLEKEYQTIGRKLTSALEESAVTLGKLQTYAATLSLSVRRCYEELRENSLPTEIKGTTHMGEFLGVVNRYSNFLNPALLVDAVNEFGDKDTKTLMKTYNERLDEFQKTTTLVQFVTECMYEEDLPEGYVEIELVMKSNWEQKTLKDIKPPKRSWLLNKVYFGSLRVFFSISDLSDLKEEDVQEFIRKHAKQVHVNGQCILDLESQCQGHAVPCLQETVQQIEGPTRPKEVTFRFSDKVIGKNVILSDDGLEARRRDVSKQEAGVYIATPLSGKFDFALEIVSSNSAISGSLVIGVAQCPRGSHHHLDLPYQIRYTNPSNVCYWSYDEVFNSLGGDKESYTLFDKGAVTKYGTVNLRDLQESDTLAMEISERGDLSFYVNGTHQGVAATGLYREDRDLYPVVNVSGSCNAVKIITAAMSGCVRPAEDQIRPVAKTINTIQFGFHPVTGRNIILLEDRRYARTRDPKTTSFDAVVYGSHRLDYRSKFQIEIVENTGPERWNVGSIQFGVVRLPTSRGLPNRQFNIPSCSEAGENHCVWRGSDVWNRLDGSLVRKHYGSVNLDGLQQGDAVGMRVAYDGSLSFFVNGKSQGLALKGLLKDGYDVYPVVDIRGNFYDVRITRAVSESHPEDMQVLGLQELCLEKIASCLDWSSKDVSLLPLPPRQKDKLEQYIDYL